MSAVASFGNVVNSLRSVRDDYHEQLKSVPQYEAFLLVESSTEKVAGTLNAIVAASTSSMASEVVEALELAKAKFRQHLASVPEYRALLAIDKLIAEVSVDLGLKTTAIDATLQTSTAEPQAASVPDASLTRDQRDEPVSTQPEQAGSHDTPLVAHREASLERSRESDEVAEMDAVSRIQDALKPDLVATDIAPPIASTEAAQSRAIHETSQESAAEPSTAAPPEHDVPRHDEEKAA